MRVLVLAAGSHAGLGRKTTFAKGRASSFDRVLDSTPAYPRGKPFGDRSNDADDALALPTIPCNKRDHAQLELDWSLSGRDVYRFTAW